MRKVRKIGIYFLLICLLSVLQLDVKAVEENNELSKETINTMEDESKRITEDNMPEQKSEVNNDIKNNNEGNIEQKQDETDIEDNSVEDLAGFHNEEGKIYYYENNVKVTGLKEIEGILYVFDENGALVLGWNKVGENTYYYTQEAPYIAQGIKEINGQKYYFDPITGRQLFGEQKIQGKWYYFDEDGRMITGFYDLPGKKVYYNDDGSMCYGERKIDNSWYYFHPVTGKMTTGWCNLPGKKVYYNDDGTMCYGEKKINNKWYYFHKTTGKMTTGWCNLPGKKVYYNSNGTMCYGEKKINNKWYYFHKTTGKMTTGWCNLPGKKVYYNSNGTMCYGEKKINNKWYYFHKTTGKMITGWYNLPGKRVYYGSNGAMVYGAQTIGGVKYNFDKVTGALLGDNSMLRKAQSYGSSTKWLILVDTKKNKVGIYSGSKNNWTQAKYWSCTSGARRTPTVKGTFTVKGKGLRFGSSSYTCWYYTQFYGNYLFHSVLYKPGSKTTIKDGRLGINASHGCVRLSLSNAKWIYDNIPKGTKVVIY